jgi:ectoine hydroxylase-related dioxygenase (phytanoyl-CoA dioxygenase family)
VLDAAVTLKPVAVQTGDALLFTPLHLHAARPPIDGPRVSIDLRIVPAGSTPPGPSFSPSLEGTS